MPTRRSQSWNGAPDDSGLLSEQIYSSWPRLSGRGIERLQDLGTAHLGSDYDAQSFPRVFVKRGDHLVRTPIAQLVMHKVDRPDVVPIFWPELNNRRVMVITTLEANLALIVPDRQPQSVVAPKTLYPFVVHPPAFGSNQLCDFAIVIPTVLLGQPDQRQVKPGVECPTLTAAPLVLCERTADAFIAARL